MRYLLLLSLLLALPCQATPFPFTVLHTNDLHSHVEGSGPDAYLGQPTKQKSIRGHYARLTTLIANVREDKRKANEPVLLVDAGDFFSGTLFHALTPSRVSTASPELEFFSLNQYDAFAIGNHEFDAGEAGFSRLLAKAKGFGLSPRLLASNLQPAMAARFEGLVSRWTVKELRAGSRTIRVGLVGFLGLDAARVSAPTRGAISFVGYDDKTGKESLGDLKALAKGLATELREKNGVDLVIALIHGGDSEDRGLAKVDGVDLVISGHTHELYPSPLVESGKLVAQAGCDGHYLGRLELQWDGKKVTRRTNSPTHLAVDAQVPFNQALLNKIESYKAELEGPLSPLRFRYSTPVTRVTKSLDHGGEPNNALGIFVTSQLREELNRLMAEPVDVYFTSMGVIRGGMTAVEDSPTPYQFSDIFRILPLGFGPNGEIGGSIRSVYLTKQDLWRLMNFLEVYRHLSSGFSPAYSNTLKYRVRSWGIPLVNRIAELTLHGKPYSEWPELIHVATNDYVAWFFDKVPGLSKGMINLVARDKNGTAVATFLSPPVPPEPALFAKALLNHSR